MGRSPCCEERNLKKGPWTPEEDEKLVESINKHGHGNWRALPKLAGLNRCGKSCRLRWTNYLRPDIKRGHFTEDDERLIVNLHSVLGNKWSRIASHLPGRTDNEIKNYWNTHIRKKLLQMGIDPNTHKPRTDLNPLLNLSHLLQLGNSMTSPSFNALKLQADAAQLAKIHLLQNILQIINTNTVSNIQNNFNLNDANNLYSKQLNSSTPQDFMNPGFFTTQSTEHQLQAIQEVDINMKNTGLDSFFNDLEQKENLLPPLVSGSSENTTSAHHKENKTDDIAYASTSSDIFETWDKLLDEETPDSYWKNILELTSSPSSPISW